MIDKKEYILSRLKNHFSTREREQLVSILFEDIYGLADFSEEKVAGIVERLIKGEPIQYITGKAPFYGYFFEVNDHVLIPRPETEELVYAVEKFLKKENLIEPVILDIGTGSGCIPITLSKLFPKANIMGMDISQEALETAIRNNKKLGASVEFMLSDFLNLESLDSLKEVDVLISNPPYIPYKEKHLLGQNVRAYEPGLALFVENDDPLVFYKKIQKLTQAYGKRIAVFLECNEYNAKEVVALFGEDFEVELIQDLQGKDRIVKALKGFVI